MRMVARYAVFEQSDLDDIMIKPALPIAVAEVPPPLDERSQKRRRRPEAAYRVSLRETGAGEGIRTLDPNLGKVVLYP